jgi:hypothetical protein
MVSVDVDKCEKFNGSRLDSVKYINNIMYTYYLYTIIFIFVYLFTMFISNNLNELLYQLTLPKAM